MQNTCISNISNIMLVPPQLPNEFDTVKRLPVEPLQWTAFNLHEKRLQSGMNALSMTSRELESESPALITAFNVVQMTGLALLLAVILTAWLAPSVKRFIVWFNVFISWIFSASSFLLLMGRQTGPEPPFVSCLFQSMMIYAAPAMNACVCVSFALEPFFNVSAAAAQTPASRNWKLFIVSLPYITPFLVCLEVLVIGLSRRDASSTTQCHRNVLPFHDPNTMRPIDHFPLSLNSHSSIHIPIEPTGQSLQGLSSCYQYRQLSL
ncbi:hypothetical protein BDN71DRAFT_735926 [Pleurotus eryngii]|uniref:Uncharacterized protein n=1 Tax=Pleurotus eryngii TaxID=5323 RepID=A0A9P6DGI2_PLEER|nr:hypothetical protein BDN71DRAFT_735926 [Pleurotus eryngii]